MRTMMMEWNNVRNLGGGKEHPAHSLVPRTFLLVAASAANTTFEQNVALVNIYTTWYEITAFAGTTKSIFF